jgi:hypothetical protein
MTLKKTNLLVLSLLGFGLTGLHAQQTIPASGGNAAGSGGSASYTVGQVICISQAGTNETALASVQQPFEISIVANIENMQGNEWQCLVYPNPTTNALTLKTGAERRPSLTYSLYDSNGKLLENKKIENNETIIVTANLSPSIYFLKVIQDQKTIRTFKIIKH